VTSGQAVTLSALHINCADPNGNVTVTVNPGNQTIVLVDDGLAPDQAAADGIYTGTFIPTSGGYTLAFPRGDVVTVEVPNATYDSSAKRRRAERPVRSVIPVCFSTGGTRSREELKGTSRTPSMGPVPTGRPAPITMPSR